MVLKGNDGVIWTYSLRDIVKILALIGPQNVAWNKWQFAKPTLVCLFQQVLLIYACQQYVFKF